MSTLQKFWVWLLCVIGFFIFSTVIINIYLHPDKIGGTIYNITHREQTVSENNVTNK